MSQDDNQKAILSVHFSQEAKNGTSTVPLDELKGELAYRCRTPYLVRLEPMEHVLHPISDNSSATLGRGADCDIAIDHSSVSRRHARIERRKDERWVVDLASTNGTFVNGVGVREQRLEDGDYLRVGSCMYRFCVPAYRDEDPSRRLAEYCQRALRGSQHKISAAAETLPDFELPELESEP